MAMAMFKQDTIVKTTAHRSSVIRKSALVGAVIMAMGVGVSTNTYAAYGWNPGTVHSASSNLASKLASETTNRIAKSQISLQTAIQDNTALINEAIVNNIKQEATSAAQIADADLESRKMKAAAQDSVDIANKKIDVMLDYGSGTGQGYAACKVYAENTQAARAIGEAVLKTTELVQQVDNAPGTLARTLDQVQKQRKEVHDANFCTESEVAAGTCEAVGELPGGDTNATLMFESAPAKSLVGVAKTAIRQNILGSPDVAISADAAKTATGQAYLYNTNRKTALAAFPAYSLAYLQAMTEVREDLTDAQGKNVSPQEMLFNTVARYYGTEEATEWQKSMMQQRPRGLLVELAKLEGLSAYMDYQRYLTNQRIGGNLAALTLAETIPMEDRMIEQHNRMLRSSTKASVVSQ